MPFLEVEGVTGGYGRLPVLHDVGFTADAGQITAMLGANGAGKTTSLRAIMGTASVHSGRIRVEGTDITGWPSNRIIRETGIAIVPEGRALFPELSVRENLIMGAYPVKVEAGEIARRIDAVADRFEAVRRKMQHKANTLSGGEQQMVAIGRALMSRPRLLLADEVSQGLAPVIVQGIWKFFRDVLEDGTTVLLVEQNVSAALKIAHSAIHLRDGRVVDQGDPGHFRAEDGLLTNFI